MRKNDGMKDRAKEGGRKKRNGRVRNKSELWGKKGEG